MGRVEGACSYTPGIEAEGHAWCDSLGYWKGSSEGIVRVHEELVTLGSRLVGSKMRLRL